MIHNATIERGIIGLTLPSSAEGNHPWVGAQRRPEGDSQGPRGCVEPIIMSEVWCYDVISQQSQRESERGIKRERERERETCVYAIDASLLVRKRKRGQMRDKIRARESERARERERERERDKEQQPPTTIFYKLVHYGFMFYHNAARAGRVMGLMQPARVAL
jgi:hypothetical protein